METRKILFVLSNSSSQKIIESSSETLGQLKSEMRSAGISYENMTFFEGRTRTELKDDASLLPTNIPVAAKGGVAATVTNDLVFMLTTQNKKIRSGAMSRTEAYAAIKAGNLQSTCVTKFGKNFTQCSTTDLISLLGNSPVAPATPVKPESKVKAEVKSEVTEKVSSEVGDQCVVIESAGANKLAVIKAVKEFTGLGLKEVKDIVDGTPSIVEGLTKSVAQAIVSAITEAGGIAHIRTVDSEANMASAPIVMASTVDMKLRTLFLRLLEEFVDEDMLEGDYTDLIDEAEELLSEEATPSQIPTSSAPATKKNVVSANEKLSSSDVSNMFGNWAK